MQMMMATGTAVSYFNPADKSGSILLSNNNATAEGSTSAWSSVRSITAHSTGKWYAELHDDVAQPTYLLFGVATSSATLANFCGFDAAGWGIHCSQTNAPVYHNSVSTSSGSGLITTGGSACVAVDFDAGKIWLGTSALTGTWSGGGNPATGTSPTYTFTPNTALFLAASIFASPQKATLRNQVGENALTIPSGFAMFA